MIAVNGVRAGPRRVMRFAGCVATSAVVVLATALSGAAAEGDGSTAQSSDPVAVTDARFVTAYDALLQGGGVTSEGVGLARRRGAPSADAIRLGGVPPGATVARAFLYWTTIGSADATVRLNGRAVNGQLVGTSSDTCWELGANRVYRANVTRMVPGNGTYWVSGVGNQGAGDGQGASLVVAFGRLAADTATRVVIRDGARSLATFGSSTTVQVGDSSASVPQSAELHMGVGDGQAFDERAVKVEGRAVTGPDLFSGTDGPMWDDVTIPVPAALVGHPTSVRVTLPTLSDCLVWSYVALIERFPLTQPAR